MSRWRARLSYVHHDVEGRLSSALGVSSYRPPPALLRSAAAANAVLPGRRAVVGRRPASAARRLLPRRRVHRLLCLSGRCCWPVRREEVQFRRSLRAVGRRTCGALSVSGVVQQLRRRCRQLARLLHWRHRLRQRLRDAKSFLSTYDRHWEEVWRKVWYV